MTTALSIWENKEEIKTIKEIYAKDLTPKQFECFVGLGRAGNLDPFNREIWCVVYKGTPQIFIGRDGYRKISQSNPDYDYHRTEAVYETDDIQFIDGQIRHAWSPVNRKNLIGAYCVVKRKSSSMPSYVYVRLEDYDKGYSVWKDLKETMIQKVAEAQALRQAFHQMFKGTYHQSELAPEEKHIPIIIEGTTQTEKMKSLLKTRTQNTADSNVDSHTRIDQLMHAIDFPAERLEKALQHYGVAEISDLSNEQRACFIGKLETIKNSQHL